MWISLLIVAFLWSLSLQFGDNEANEKVCFLNLSFYFFFSVKNRKFRRGKPSCNVDHVFEEMFPKWNVFVFSVTMYCNSAPITCYASSSQAIKNESFVRRPLRTDRGGFCSCVSNAEPQMRRKNLRQTKRNQPLLG